MTKIRKPLLKVYQRSPGANRIFVVWDEKKASFWKQMGNWHPSFIETKTLNKW